MRARRVGLLVLILGFGTAVETIWNVKTNASGLSIGATGCRVTSGQSFNYETIERVDVPAGTALEVENAFGSVHVVAGTAGETRVTLRKVVYEDKEEVARAFADTIHLEKQLAAGVLKLGTNRAQLDSSRGFETHLEIRVPPSTAVKVRNEHGRVDVMDVASADLQGSFDDMVLEHVAGAADVENRHGDATISDVKGTLRLTVRHGDSVVEDVQDGATLVFEHGDVSVKRVGSLVLEGAHGSVRVEDVKRDARMHAEHTDVEASDIGGKADVATSFKDVKLSKVHGDAQVKTLHGAVEASDLDAGLHVEASFDDVQVERIAGLLEVSVEHGGVVGRDLAGGAHVKASGDDVELSGFKGTIAVETQHGSVRLTPGGPLTDAVTVSATNGGIHLDVSAGSRFDLLATSGRGDVELHVPGADVTHSEPSRVAARLGAGGNAVQLTTDHGDVEISGTGTAAEEPLAGSGSGSGAEKGR